MFRDGRGVDRDPERAALWFRRAAERGHPQVEKYLTALLSSHPKLRVPW